MSGQAARCPECGAPWIYTEKQVGAPQPGIPEWCPRCEHFVTLDTDTRQEPS